MYDCCLLIVTKEEKEGCEVILPKIDTKLFKEVLVVDANSLDGTGRICEQLGFKVIYQTQIGIREGMIQSLPNISAKYILTFSPDGNCDPEKLPLFLNEIKSDKDLIIGSRYLEGGKSDDDDVITKFGNWFFTKSINILYKTNLCDSMVIYRMFKKDLIYDLKLDHDNSFLIYEKIFRTKIGWEPLMTVRALKLRKSIKEINVGEPKRIGGTRKLQIIRWGAAFYSQIILEKFIFRKLN